MGWNLRAISATMLVILCALPVSGALCALACAQTTHAEDAGHHHGAAPEATQPASVDGPVMTGASTHPCDHATAVQHVTTAAERTQMAAPTPGAVLVTATTCAPPLLQRARAAHGAPPGSILPTSLAFVLRV